MADPSPSLRKLLTKPLAGATGFAIFVALIWKDLGLNLLADALGAWFTLFFIDQVAEKFREAQRGPAYEAMLREAQRTIQTFDMLLAVVGKTAQPGFRRRPRPHLDAYQQMAEVLGGVNLLVVSPRVSLGPMNGQYLKLSWCDALPNELGLLRHRIEVFLDRYVTVADAELINAAQLLEHVGLFQIGTNHRLLAMTPMLGPPIWAEALEYLQAFVDAYELSRARHGLRGRGDLTPADLARLPEFWRTAP